MTVSAQDRARKIKIILFDVDGVLTDGGIWLIPVPMAVAGTPTTVMVEAKGYNAHDGTAISLARLGGLKCGVITKRISETVALRARDLKLEFVYQGQAFKMKAVREIMAREGVSLDEIAYVGDGSGRVAGGSRERLCGTARSKSSPAENGSERTGGGTGGSEKRRPGY